MIVCSYNTVWLDIEQQNFEVFTDFVLFLKINIPQFFMNKISSYTVCKIHITIKYFCTHFIWKDAKQAIILEDDLEVSPDFFR